MNTVDLEKLLEGWKKVLLVAIGASATLLLTSVAEFTEGLPQADPGWFGVWLVLQLGVTPPGLILLIGKTFRSLPLSERLDTAFGFLTTALITLLALAVRAYGITVDTFPALILPSVILMAMFGGSLPLTYLWLKRDSQRKQNDLFP